MSSIKGKTALVTGASSGIGKSTVEKLLVQGVTVYAAARRIEMMRDLEKMGAHILKMDLTDENSMTEGINTIISREGSVDILVNNAGYGSYGAVEEVGISEAKRQFEVNIFGLARLIQLVLPKMRENRYGKIVNISSVGGKIYTSFGGWYHATKHALEGLSDCLRVETKEFGIDVIIIEPGGIATEWGDIAAENLKKVSGSGPYAKSANKVADMMDKMYKSNQLSKPDVIANVIVKSVSTSNPKTRYAAGMGAVPILFFRHWLSDKMFDTVIRFMA